MSVLLKTTNEAELYAGFGIIEFWVINAVPRETRIHRQPAGTSFGNATDYRADEPLVSLRAPNLASLWPISTCTDA